MNDPNLIYYIIGAAVLLLLVVLLVRKPKQKVSLDEEKRPARPHMVTPEVSHEGQGIVDQAAAATADVAGQALQTDVHEELPGAVGEPDDLRKLKGVGPKFATTLNGLGIHRYEQLARLNDDQIDHLDGQLGSFKGRLKRDQVTEQAQYLARGDTDGYEARFGKL